jgi:hypothetical protein
LAARTIFVDKDNLYAESSEEVEESEEHAVMAEIKPVTER